MPRRTRLPLFGLALAGWAAAALYMTVLSRAPVLHPRVQWIPFCGPGMSVWEVAANIALFLPFGGLFLELCPVCQAWECIGLGALLSFGIETLQFSTRRGVFDTTDLIANTCGAALGTLCYLMLKSRIRNGREQPTRTMF